MKYLMLVFAALLTIVTSSGVFADSREIHGYNDNNNNNVNYNNGYNQSYSNGQLSNNGVWCGGNGLCSTTISWYVNGNYNNSGSQGLVTVSVPTSSNYAEQTERIFACGNSSSQEAPWIRPGDTYVFRLYTGNNCSYIPYGGAVDTLIVRL